jgi:hypothetical protein
MAIAGAVTSFAGGMLQRADIIRQTERRIEQMRLQAAQHVGQATAAAGASGVEMGSSTIQKHLEGMRQEFAKAISNVSDVGGSAANNAIISAIGGSMSQVTKGMTDYGAELDAIGESKFAKAFEGMPETSPGVAMPEFDWRF